MFDVPPLSECFGEPTARMDRRNRFKELMTRGSTGSIEIVYREYKDRPKDKNNPRITYHLAIKENSTGPLSLRNGLLGDEKNEENLSGFSTQNGRGEVIFLKRMTSAYRNLCLPPKCWQSSTPIGKTSKSERLGSFITGWYLSYISADNARVVPESGPQERLSLTGDNLPNVIHMREQHPSRPRES